MKIQIQFFQFTVLKEGVENLPSYDSYQKICYLSSQLKVYFKKNKITGVWWNFQHLFWLLSYHLANIKNTIIYEGPPWQLILAKRIKDKKFFKKYNIQSLGTRRLWCSWECKTYIQKTYEQNIILYISINATFSDYMNRK